MSSSTLIANPDERIAPRPATIIAPQRKFTASTAILLKWLGRGALQVMVQQSTEPYWGMPTAHFDTPVVDHRSQALLATYLELGVALEVVKTQHDLSAESEEWLKVLHLGYAPISRHSPDESHALHFFQLHRNAELPRRGPLARYVDGDCRFVCFSDLFAAQQDNHLFGSQIEEFLRTSIISTIDGYTAGAVLVHPHEYK